MLCFATLILRTISLSVLTKPMALEKQQLSIAFFFLADFQALYPWPVDMNTVDLKILITTGHYNVAGKRVSSSHGVIFISWICICLEPGCMCIILTYVEHKKRNVNNLVKLIPTARVGVFGMRGGRCRIVDTLWCDPRTMTYLRSPVEGVRVYNDVVIYFVENFPYYTFY